MAILATQGSGQVATSDCRCECRTHRQSLPLRSSCARVTEVPVNPVEHSAGRLMSLIVVRVATNDEAEVMEVVRESGAYGDDSQSDRGSVASIRHAPRGVARAAHIAPRFAAR